MIRNLFGGASKCRTIDKVDIFGDSSGVALYQLDGNANDTGGNYHGTETAITYGGGVYERGAVFNGTSSQVANTYTGSNDFTLSAWIKPDNISPTTWKQITGGVSATNPYSLFMSHTTNGVLQFQDSQNGTNINSPSNTLTTNGAWYHVVFIKTGTARKIYCNGVEVASDNAGVSTVLLPTGLSIGKYYGSTSQTFLGSIDQVRIFNRAITATEVATLYAECAPTSTVDNINPFMDGSLKALYQFNGDATDKTGVYNGTATNVTYGTGKFGQCAVFDGTTSYISAGDNNIFSPSINNITISGWIKFTSTGTMMMVGKGASSNYEYMFGVNNTKVALYLFQSAGASHITDITGVGKAINDGYWHHIVATIDYLKIVSVYVDGTKVATATSFTGTIVNGTASFDIGRRSDSLYYFNGSIEQVRFFNKALTPMEVASLYNETTPLEEPMYKLVDPFRDDSGKSLLRFEGNHLDEKVGDYTGVVNNITYSAGRSGRCAVFNGTSSYISMPNPNLNNYSISVWIKTNQLSPSPFSAITNGSSATNPYSYAIYQNPNGVIVFQDSHTSASSLNTPSNTITSTSTWYHIVATKVGTARKIYINGTLSVSDSAGTATVAQPAGFMIGKYYGQNIAPYSFNGSIDQLRIFNRALTASEAQTLYTEGA